MLKACKLLRATASQSITIWKLDLDRVCHLTFSDCGGIGSASKGGAQSSWITGIADIAVSNGGRGRFSPMAWKSNKIKRAVPSTIAGETYSLSDCLGEAEWIALLIKDARTGDVQLRNWRIGLGPFCNALRSNCELCLTHDNLHIIDAKSVYDVLIKNTAGSQKDRRTAVELAVIRDSFNRTSGTVRWVPHTHMPADIMNKADVAKGNDALHHLLKHGTVQLIDEKGEMARRQAGLTETGRTKAASRRALQTTETGDTESNDQEERTLTGMVSTSYRHLKDRLSHLI